MPGFCRTNKTCYALPIASSGNSISVVKMAIPCILILVWEWKLEIVPLPWTDLCVIHFEVRVHLKTENGLPVISSNLTYLIELKQNEF